MIREGGWAEQYWMTGEELLRARLVLSARRWALAAVLAGALLGAALLRPGGAFLAAHAATAALGLGAGARLAARRAATWVRAPWQRWTAEVLCAGAGLAALGLAAAVAAGRILGWAGHPAPFGPLARLEAPVLAGGLAAAWALAALLSGLWALVWRGRLGRP